MMVLTLLSVVVVMVPRFIIVNSWAPNLIQFATEHVTEPVEVTSKFSVIVLAASA